MPKSASKLQKIESTITVLYLPLRSGYFYLLTKSNQREIESGHNEASAEVKSQDHHLGNTFLKNKMLVLTSNIPIRMWKDECIYKEQRSIQRWKKSETWLL